MANKDYHGNSIIFADNPLFKTTTNIRTSNISEVNDIGFLMKYDSAELFSFRSRYFSGRYPKLLEKTAYLNPVLRNTPVSN